jgi:hypothetical protein
VIRLCLAVALVLGACSGDDDDASEPTTAPTTAPAPTTTTGGSEPVPVLDWDALPVPPVVVEGWEVGHCPGDAPLLCVGRPGGRSGTLETMTFASDVALEDFGAVFVGSASADRLATCPAGTTVAPDDEVEVAVGGQPGRRIGFQVRLGDGTLVEHGVSWVREEADGLRLVGATGLHLERACLEPIGEFAIDDFEAVDELLDRLVATSEF